MGYVTSVVSIFLFSSWTGERSSWCKAGRVQRSECGPRACLLLDLLGNQRSSWLFLIMTGREIAQKEKENKNRFCQCQSCIGWSYDLFLREALPQAPICTPVKRLLGAGLALTVYLSVFPKFWINADRDYILSLPYSLNASTKCGTGIQLNPSLLN